MSLLLLLVLLLVLLLLFRLSLHIPASYTLLFLTT